MKKKNPITKKKFPIKQLIFFAGIAIIGFGIAGSFALFQSTKATTTHTVMLTASGFYPRQLRIALGDTVTFVTNINNSFWPASNVHPQHTMYQEFDPKHEIAAKDSWSFTYTREGVWPYHDHLHPFFTGVIIVTAKDGTSPSLFSCDNIRDKTEEEKLRCFEDMIHAEISENGIGASLNLIANVYATDPLFAKNCHYYTHIIGEAAYKKFRERQDFELSTKTNYCGFGFYHGFIDAMAILDRDLAFAREFCNFVDTRLAGEKGNFAQGPCYHGIGHGIVDSAPKKAWGDAEAMIEPGLVFCKKIAVNKTQLYGCATGVFNSLSIAYSAGTFNMKIDEDNPLWICRKLHGVFQEACYPQMMVVIQALVGDDLLKASAYLDEIPEDEHAKASMENIASLVANHNLLQEESYDDFITSCQTLSERFSESCLIGFVSGLIEFGKPSLEYKKALAFCMHDILTNQEKDTCHAHILPYLAYLYTKEKFAYVCILVHEEYRKYCNQN